MTSLLPCCWEKEGVTVVKVCVAGADSLNPLIRCHIRTG